MSRFQKPTIIGILNITPDSFFTGNSFLDTDKAIAHANKMIEDGAKIIDIGAESTRPGSVKIDSETETHRLIPILKKLKQEKNILISVDTYKSETAIKVLEEGADIINDVYALRFDEVMVKVLQDFTKTKIILVHMQGNPAFMQKEPNYNDVVQEITDFFKERIDYCLKNNIAENRIMIDPGIGFGKNFYHNISILQNIENFKTLGYPIVLAASRKSFINEIYKSTPDERLIGSLATTVLAGYKHIDYVRVHDVKEHHQILETLDIINF